LHPDRANPNAVLLLACRFKGNMRRSILCTSCIVFLGSALPTAVFAETYDALCSGTKCTIDVSAESISSPYGSIPAKRVTYWGGGGESRTSIGTGVATTVLFGGIGLLGFLAKNHDYSFTVNGFNSEGIQTTIQLQFKNSRPAKRFMQEMPMVTNLGMGQTRTIAQIKAAEAGQQETLAPSSSGERLDPLPKARVAAETN
jgi:hypothetical protein